MPRESLKTTFFVESYITKLILDNPHIRIYLLCDTGQHAIQRVKAVRNYLQSPAAEMYCPSIHQRILNADKWTQNEISLPIDTQGTPRSTKEYNLVACGIDSPQTGIHVDVAILDDVVNEEDKKSKARREATIDWFPGLFDMVEEDGQIIIIGTPWCPVDLYNEIQTVYGDVFRIYKQSIYNPDGSTWLPDTYTPERIERLKKKPIHFSHQYLCQPVGGEDTLFNEDWFNLVTTAPNCNRIIWGLDPAYAEKDITDACSNALVVWGDGKAGAGILNSRIKRESLLDFKRNSILKYAQSYWPDMIVVEDNGVQKAALQLMRANDFEPGTQEYNTYGRLVKLMVGTGSMGGRDKVTRAQPMADYAELNGVWVVDNPNNRALLNQILLFPAIDENDGVDAASNGFTRIRKGKPKVSPPQVVGTRDSYKEEFV
jgi:hypothetical protein